MIAFEQQAKGSSLIVWMVPRSELQSLATEGVTDSFRAGNSILPSCFLSVPLFSIPFHVPPFISCCVDLIGGFWSSFISFPALFPHERSDFSVFFQLSLHSAINFEFGHTECQRFEDSLVHHNSVLLSAYAKLGGLRETRCAISGLPLKSSQVSEMCQCSDSRQ
jgi:hypothetical protein